MEILKKKPEKSSETEIQTTFSRIPTIHTRSMSHDDDQLSSNSSFTDSVPYSPDSVLLTPKLNPVFWGKELRVEIPKITRKIKDIERKMFSRRKSMRLKTGETKSLSELEFEELKGFMDLGFVFTEEDNKDSELVRIVPGLQRLGKKSDEIREEDEGRAVSRPYLSEAWEVIEPRKKEKAAAALPLMKWKVPELRNEVDMKDSLKLWAQSVAFAIR